MIGERKETHILQDHSCQPVKKTRRESKITHKLQGRDGPSLLARDKSQKGKKLTSCKAKVAMLSARDKSQKREKGNLPTTIQKFHHCQPEMTAKGSGGLLTFCKQKRAITVSK